MRLIKNDWRELISDEKGISYGGKRYSVIFSNETYYDNSSYDYIKLRRRTKSNSKYYL